MGNWKWLFDNGGVWKGHVVPKELVLDLEGDLFDRKHEHEPVFTVEDQKTEVFIDMPGMCLMKRAVRVLDADGLQLEVPSQDFETVLSQLKLAEKRAFRSGAEYYKLHSWRFCVVFTPAQRTALLAAMEAQLADAKAEGDADDARFLAAVQRVNQDRVQVVSEKARALEAAAEGKKGAN